MKIRAAGLAVLVTASMALAQDAAPKGNSIENDSSARTATTTTIRPEIAGWGKLVDPDGDCKFFVAEGELLISVPGATGPHDLAAEIQVINAPRVLQPVRGDFVLQVVVDGRFGPGDQSTLPGRTGYNGAGLVVMTDSNNVICLARAVVKRDGSGAEHYANFEMRAHGEIERLGQTDDNPLPATGPVFLRLERREQKILGAISEDGVHWHKLPAKELPSDWPDEMQAGVVAISTSKMEFDPRFSKFQVLK
jgi:regulation of enolase protein 1 (concanavalin A-like superfamily)